MDPGRSAARAFPDAIAACLLAACALAAQAADPAEWKITGRTLPQREFLQPPPDDALPPYRACPVEGRIAGSVPTILPQLVRRWLEILKPYQPGLQVDTPPPYDEPQGAGSERLRMFLDGKIDFAFLTRDLSASDAAAFRRAHGFEATSIPVSGGSFRHFGFVDAVTIVVNRDNPVAGLTLAQLDAIFSKSLLRGSASPARTWGDVGVAEWADRPIHVVGHGAWAREESARATFIRNRVMDSQGKRGAWRDDLGPPDAGDSIVTERVAADRYAIGFTGMGHLRPDIRTVALAPSAGAPFFEPSHENVARADFPLARVFYIVVAKKPDQPVPPALDEFIRFLVSRDGQRAVLDQGVFLPLRASQATLSRQMLGSRSCGP